MSPELEEIRKRVAIHPRYRHRVLPKEVEETVEDPALLMYYGAITEAITLEETDAFRNGYEPEIWKEADEELRKFREEHPVGVLLFVTLGGIRSSKTEWRSKRLVENMVATKDYKAWASHSTQESSREAQQTKVYKYLPSEYKNEKGRMRVGSKLKVNYTPWGGFTEDSFAFPANPGGVSECRFKFYSMNPRSLEGAEINEGWLDEQAGLEWLNAYVGRCTTRNGIVFLTFAAIDGYTPLVKTILSGATTLKWVKAELLPKQEGIDPSLPFDKGGQMVPRLQENLNMVIQTGEQTGMRLKLKARIMYFHTQDNPYGNPESLIKTLEGASREKILNLFYGVPTQTIASQLKFSRAIHVMTVADYVRLKEKLEKTEGGKGTRYHLVDPCSGRNWFMGWFWCWAPGKAIMYREWPTTGHLGAHIEGIGDPGPWAVPGRAPDGERGEAQRPFRFGYDRYCEEIGKAEGWWIGSLKESVDLMNNEEAGERIFSRYVDGRYAVSPTQTREGATTWIEQMEELGLTFLAMRGEGKIFSDEADGSVEMINKALAFDEKTPIGQFSKELGAINEPSLMILETCTNTINALETWTGRDGQKGAVKDPIDVLRGFYLSELDYQEEGKLYAWSR